MQPPLSLRGCNVITEPLLYFCLELVEPTELYGLSAFRGGLCGLSDQEDGGVASSLQLRNPCTRLWPPDCGIYLSRLTGSELPASLCWATLRRWTKAIMRKIATTTKSTSAVLLEPACSNYRLNSPKKEIKFVIVLFAL